MTARSVLTARSRARFSAERLRSGGHVGKLGPGIARAGPVQGVRVHGLAGFLGVALLLIVLWDAFETVVLPRHVTRSLRLARLFFRFLWRLWTTFARGIRSVNLRETYLSFFGPLSMLVAPGVLGRHAGLALRCCFGRVALRPTGREGRLLFGPTSTSAERHSPRSGWAT